jgi:NAD(P)H-hydrate epimerase
MPIPIISIAQMRDWEQATWAVGQTDVEVIRRVGIVLAHRALQLTRPLDLILILAGKGNNGADARAARDHLGDRRLDLLDIKNPAADLSNLEASLSLRPALVIDGLFGIGLNRPLGNDWIRLIERVNKAQVSVLAVDIPSGLNADTGEPHGAAIEASTTLTIGAPKQGLLRPPAWGYVGRLEVATEVGLLPCPHRAELSWALPGDFCDYPPRRPNATHKGTYGHLVIVAGSVGYHGAAVLAARAAQRAQPGLITLHTPEAVYHPVASQLQAVMVTPWVPQKQLAEAHTAALLGPGLAARDLPDELKQLTRLLWHDSPSPVVVDASALDWVPLGPLPKNAIRVLTPHPGEAARLLRSSAQQVQSDRVGALRSISRQFGDAWVVLKGHQTLVGRNSGEISVNSSGNPGLAQGGSGDVLAGFIAGLLAQPALQTDPYKTLCYAVWQHGASADRLQAARRNWGVEDLIDELGR